MNKIRPLIVEEEDFIDINKNTAAQIAYTASVGRDNTANPKNSEQSAVRTKDVVHRKAYSKKSRNMPLHSDT